MFLLHFVIIRDAKNSILHDSRRGSEPAGQVGSCELEQRIEIQSMTAVN